MRAAAALLALALAATAAACGAAPPRVWTSAQHVLPADIRRVVFADLGQLAESKLGRWILDKAGGKLGLDCRWTRGELVWVADEHGHAAVFASLPGTPPEAVARCAGGLHAIWLSPAVFVLGRQDAVTALTAGAGAFVRDPRFAEALVDVDYGAAVWAVFRSRGRDARGLVRLNVTVGDGRVAVGLRIPAGGRAKAWAMAYMLERELERERRRRPERVPFDTFSAGADGDDVVVYASLREAALEDAMDELLR